MNTKSNSKKISNIYINSIFSTNSIIKINANYNYSYDDSNNFSHIYKFYNNYQKFKEIKLNHNKTANVINDEFNIPSINSTKINLLIYLVNNNNDNSSIKFFDYNTIQITYNDDIDTSKIDMNTDNISSNLKEIDINKSNILSNFKKIETNQSNISSNLEKIDKVSKNKLINISDGIFYDNDAQINFSNDLPFFEKEYDISFKKDDL